MVFDVMFEVWIYCPVYFTNLFALFPIPIENKTQLRQKMDCELDEVDCLTLRSWGSLNNSDGIGLFKFYIYFNI